MVAAMRRPLVSLLCLLACSKPEPPAADAGASPTPSASASATGGPLTYRASVVTMDGKTLEECTDLTVTLVPPPNAPAGWKPKDNVIAGLLKTMKGATRIEKPCAEQFADRTVLATCETAATSKRTDGSEGQIKISASYYDYAKVGLTEAYMAICTGRQGKWKPIARDSAEWQKAKAEHAQQQKDASP